MNDKLSNYIKISEDLNNNVKDNIFELNLNQVNLSNEKNKPLEFSDMSLNVTNLEISKLKNLFKINKKILKDFFNLEIFKFRSEQDLITIVLEFKNICDNNSFDKLIKHSIEIKNLVKFIF